MLNWKQIKKQARDYIEDYKERSRPETGWTSDDDSFLKLMRRIVNALYAKVMEGLEIGETGDSTWTNEFHNSLFNIISDLNKVWGAVSPAFQKRYPIIEHFAEELSKIMLIEESTLKDWVPIVKELIEPFNRNIDEVK